MCEGRWNRAGSEEGRGGGRLLGLSHRREGVRGQRALVTEEDPYS